MACCSSSDSDSDDACADHRADRHPAAAHAIHVLLAAAGGERVRAGHVVPGPAPALGLGAGSAARAVRLLAGLVVHPVPHDHPHLAGHHGRGRQVHPELPAHVGPRALRRGRRPARRRAPLDAQRGARPHPLRVHRQDRHASRAIARHPRRRSSPLLIVVAPPTHATRFHPRDATLPQCLRLRAN